jgi:hypothetical protein
MSHLDPVLAHIKEKVALVDTIYRFVLRKRGGGVKDAATWPTICRVLMQFSFNHRYFSTPYFNGFHLSTAGTFNMHIFQPPFFNYIRGKACCALLRCLCARPKHSLRSSCWPLSFLLSHSSKS